MSRVEHQDATVLTDGAPRTLDAHRRAAGRPGGSRRGGSTRCACGVRATAVPGSRPTPTGVRRVVDRGRRDGWVRTVCRHGDAAGVTLCPDRDGAANWPPDVNSPAAAVRRAPSDPNLVERSDTAGDRCRSCTHSLSEHAVPTGADGPRHRPDGPFATAPCGRPLPWELELELELEQALHSIVEAAAALVDAEYAGTRRDRPGLRVPVRVAHRGGQHGQRCGHPRRRPRQRTAPHGRAPSSWTAGWTWGSPRAAAHAGVASADAETVGPGRRQRLAESRADWSDWR